MTYQLTHRRYTLPFKKPVRTAHGLWTERQGVIVRIEAESGAIGYGEVAPIPSFGTETLAEAEAALAALGDRIEPEWISRISPRLSCTRHGLSEALAAAQALPTAPTGSTDYLAVAALLPRIRETVADVDRSVPVYEALLMREMLARSESYWMPRLWSGLVDLRRPLRRAQ